MEREADGGAEDQGLVDRRVADLLGEATPQPLGRLHHAPALAHVLAVDPAQGVVLEDVAQRRPDRAVEGDDGLVADRRGLLGLGVGQADVLGDALVAQLRLALCDLHGLEDVVLAGPPDAAEAVALVVVAALLLVALDDVAGLEDLALDEGEAEIVDAVVIFEGEIIDAGV